MGNLIHSPQAANVLHRFHRVKYVVFAEGQDDIPFWDKILTLCGLDKFVIKPAGGCQGLDSYIDSIINNNANIIVVRDCDLTDFIGNQHIHRRVIYTYGYSIENSLFHPKNISAVIANYSREANSSELFNEVYAIVKRNIEIFEPLIVLDLTSQIYNLGISVYPNSLSRFFTGESYIASESAVSDYVNSIYGNFLDKQVGEAKRRINKRKKSNFFTIKGHLLDCIIFKILRYKARKSRRKINISSDGLYASSISQIDSANFSLVDFSFIKDQVMALLA